MFFVLAILRGVLSHLWKAVVGGVVLASFEATRANSFYAAGIAAVGGLFWGYSLTLFVFGFVAGLVIYMPPDGDPSPWRMLLGFAVGNCVVVRFAVQLRGGPAAGLCRQQRTYTTTARFDRARTSQRE